MKRVLKDSRQVKNEPESFIRLEKVLEPAAERLSSSVGCDDERNRGDEHAERCTL